MGVIANYFPSAVIKGMLAAIGIILMSKQIPVAIGYDQPDFWTSGFLGLFDSHNFFGNIKNFSVHATRGAVLVTLVSLLTLVLFQKKIIKGFRHVPAPLLAVLAGVLVNFIFTEATEGLSLKQTQLVNIPANIFSQITFPDLSQLFARVDIWKTGLVIGLLAILETLLCVEAIDKLDIHNRVTSVNGNCWHRVWEILLVAYWGLYR